MKLNVLIAALFASVALVACKDNGSTTDTTPSTQSQAAEPTTSADQASSNTGTIPPACAEYFAAIDEFAAKYPDIADNYKEDMENTKKEIADADIENASAYEASCQKALEQFRNSIENMPQ